MHLDFALELTTSTISSTGFTGGSVAESEREYTAKCHGSVGMIISASGRLLRELRMRFLELVCMLTVFLTNRVGARANHLSGRQFEVVVA